MFLKKIFIVSVCILLALNAYAEDNDVQQNIPEPASWSFPDIIQSARAIAPHNTEGRKFNAYGLAYSRDELKILSISTMPAQELQRYADIVTHAYPDAVSRMTPISCKTIPIQNLNETALANMAYASIHAIELSTRQRTATCLNEVQALMRKN